MELELVSFKTCPYVQRSRITMLHKGVDHSVTYIDLADPPQWFTDISPLGKVPILRVKNDGKEDILFESAVINEFVDEVSLDKGRLMPEDAIERATTRAWIEFGSNCLVDFYMSSIAKDEAGHTQHLEALQEKLARLDGQVVGPFFLGNEFTLADAALAPLVMRLNWFEQYTALDLTAFPSLAQWRDALLALPAVNDSIVPEWQELQAGYAVRGESLLGKRIAETGAKVATNFA
jgi:glutathione S-transferase